MGPYEILSPLGAGGMGEVYRARDTRLDRSIAIKVLPEHLSSHPELKQRLEREARAISALNHPRICTLHDVGHQNGVDFLVMEYLEGETLAERLKKGPLPLRDALRVGMEVCEALDKAHRAGIVHRDLKPGNIMLTRNGAKLMDFGLAKAVTAGLGAVTASAPLFSAAKTMSEPSRVSPLTTAGTMMGTIQYMAPEQIEGKEADARSDIFALGAVLYEMLTGKRAFEGESQISVASAILEKEPKPITSLQPLMPAALEHVIRTSLAKNPEERIQTARDVSLELKWIGEGGATVAASAAQQKTKRTPAWIAMLPWALCGALAACLVAGAILMRGEKGEEQAQYFSISLPFPTGDMSFAPNGHTVAVVGYSVTERTNALWLYEAGSQQTRRLSGTEGASFPFWSPDGTALAFFADGKLKKLEITGGPVQTICDAPSGRGGTWSRDGVIVLTTSGLLDEGLSRVPETGGAPERITTPDASLGEESNRWPSFLPDGKHFLYFGGKVTGETEGDKIYAGELGSDLKKYVTSGIGNAEYVAPGYLVFYRDKTLFAQAFDAGKLEKSGEAMPLLTEVAYIPRLARVVFAASPKYLVAERGSGVTESKLEWYDRKGNEIGSVGKPGVIGNVAVSPSGEVVAADQTDEDSQNTDVWTFDLKKGTVKRLTFDPSVDTSPVFSPDGARVVFSSSRQHIFRMYIKNADGAQEEQQLKLAADEKGDQYPSDWSRDGKYILYRMGYQLRVAELPDMKTSPIAEGDASSKNGQFSPDGKWVAYASNETGKWEVYVTSFPEGRGEWQVSIGGGTQPRWRGDGKELFYLAADGKMMSVPVERGANFDPGAPVALFQANARDFVATSELYAYGVTRDGQRFLINTQTQNAVSQPVTVILNWQAEFKK